MPTFYFDTEDGDRHEDHEGLLLPDLEAAKTEAVKMAGQMLRDSPEHLLHSRGWRVTVADEHRQPVFVIRVSGSQAEPRIRVVETP